MSFFWFIITKITYITNIYQSIYSHPPMINYDKAAINYVLLPPSLNLFPCIMFYSYIYIFKVLFYYFSPQPPIDRNKVNTTVKTKVVTIRLLII